MRWINYGLVLIAHKKNIDRFGGSHGIKDNNAIYSCIETPLSTFDGIDLYPTVEEKIIQCYYMFCKNHCFNDGNKRISIAMLLYLLKVNGFKLNMTQQELIDLGLRTASGEYSREKIICIIKEKTVKDSL